MNNSKIAFKLPLTFDISRLQDDLIIAQQYDFATHPLEYHDGSWSVINLIYSGGETYYKHEGDKGFGSQPPEKTEVLLKCPYFNEILDRMPGDIIMARLSAIPAGGRVLRHYDPVESADFGHYRLHIPIVTNNKVVFHLGFKREIWREGEIWYGDFTFPHSIKNKSDQTRIHLIVDIKESEAIKAWFPDGYLNAANKEKRKIKRRKHKDIDWYITKIEKKLGLKKNRG